MVYARYVGSGGLWEVPVHRGKEWFIAMVVAVPLSGTFVALRFNVTHRQSDTIGRRQLGKVKKNPILHWLAIYKLNPSH
jgi:hypothetical protein